MRAPWVRLVAVCLLAVSGVVFRGAAWADETEPAAEPTIQTDSTSITLGERVNVTLAGWPAGLVAVSFCGERAEQGSADCAVAASTTVTVGADGTGSGDLLAVAPPGGCPCVLRGQTLTGGISAVLPVAVPEAPVADPDDPGTDTGTDGEGETAPPRVVVASAVDGPSGWRDRLLGAVLGHRSYTLTVTVQNTGTVELPARTVQVLAGRNELGGSPVGEVDVAAVAPGGSATYSIPVSLDGLVAGRYVLHGAVDEAAAGSSFVAEVESWPWVLPLLALFAVVWVLLRRARYRGVPALFALGVVVLVAALVLAGHWGAKRWTQEARAREAQAELLDRFAPPLGSTGAAATGQPVVPVGSLPQPVVGDLVGVLRFPDLTDDPQLAVVAGVSLDQLGRGPGHYPGTALPGEIGNAVVAGHNNRSGPGGPFDRLTEVAAGDTVRFETAVGTWVYTVTGTRVVAPTEVSVLLPVRDQPGAEPTTAQLTLITCDYSEGAATRRLIVEAEIVDVLLPDEGSEEGSAAGETG
ncbi:sortase [Streptomyces sp. NBRC 109706]|uniref:sortase n=1 Tax=Streptomyces sp. NBRC 109706 TaxID=1550035 RepID=UPI0007831383|nr:sortase [Streptomyces sp. NBRC 109706]